jgi:mannose-6-phosphate isomerase-like protein (cupin superfamily)
MELTVVQLDDVRPVRAPDRSQVFVLSAVDEAGTAVFELPPAAVARPVLHPRVQEIWYVLSGRGRLWRRGEDGQEREDDLIAGTSLTSPRRTAFQFRCDGEEPLRVLGVTAPPWRGDADAAELEQGRWPATL